MSNAVKETNLVNIGVKVNEETVQVTAKSIIDILDASARNHVNDDVTLKALSVLQSSATIENLNFQGFHINSDSSKKTEIIVKTDDETEVDVTTGVKVENPYA